MKNNDLVVVSNTLSRFGLRGVHVMSMNGPVNAEAVRAQYVTPETEDVMRYVYEEKDLGAHHLVFSWPARELVQLVQDGQPCQAVMWWIGERSLLEEGGRATIREAVDLAGTLYQLRIGQAAQKALLRSLPKNATAKIGEVDLVVADWVPAGFVVMVGG